MARRTANSILNSLKSKIWLATSALAFFVSSFGLIAYLLLSFLVNDNFYAIFTIFLLSAFAIMVFGWWLSNEVVGPVEKVSLLAKSLERGFSVSLPKTSGSTETDELLETLHRNNQQLQNLVNLMEKVAGGELDVALTPLQTNDRLINSFQKLLAKVSDSIHAKQELEKLENAVAQISEEIAPVRNGNFDIEIKSDSPPVREISETFKYLLQNLGDLAAQVRADSAQAGNSALETRKIIQTVIQQDENQIRELNQAKLTLKQIPNLVQKISEELGDSAVSAAQSIEKARKGTCDAQENLKTVGILRKQIQETAKRIKKLGERSQEISQIVQLIDDLSDRTSLLALNASLQASAAGEAGRGFAVVAEEVERLADRSTRLTRQIAALTQTMQTETKDVVASMEETIHEVVVGSTLADKAGQALVEIEQVSTRLAELIKSISESAKHQAVSAEDISTAMANISKVTELVQTGAKRAADSVKMLVELSDDLRGSVAPFKLPEDKNARRKLNGETNANGAFIN